MLFVPLIVPWIDLVAGLTKRKADLSKKSADPYGSSNEAAGKAAVTEAIKAYCN